jgi:tRNA(adenine34) deaminase
MIQVYDDNYFMKQALNEAHKAYELGEVPVGAVVVSNNQIIARGHNQTEQLNDVTAHAEMIAVTAAANFLQNKYLDDCTLFVTLEPCVMCAGALYWAQLGRLVFAASDDKRGFSRLEQAILHPKTEIVRDVLEPESRQLLKAFFNTLR